MARARVVVSGRVQGVFFRAFTEETAQAFGLTGWVRNLPDGGVEAIFDGEKSDIEKAVAALRKGPPSARVADVEVSWEEHRDQYDSFSIKYF